MDDLNKSKVKYWSSETSCRRICVVWYLYRVQNQAVGNF